MSKLYGVFEADFRDFFKKAVPMSAESAAYIDNIGLPNILYYLNWIDRFIYPIPRKVLKSKNLEKISQKLNEDYNQALLKIEFCAEGGFDLTPHLSKGINIGFQFKDPKKKLNSRRDLDLLLNDWGLHHLDPSKNPRL